MQTLKKYKNPFKSLIFLFVVLFFLAIKLQAQQYTVVLDAGHGGKDPGASSHGVIEKKIALSMVLKVGAHLKKNKKIKVVYTRKSDVFVELHKRASIANDKNAVLFVSLHCDSFKPRPAAHGASTYVLGLNGNKTNMEIAKKENAVILLEDNYKKNYDYDPNSPESVIGFSVLQEENLDASLSFASIAQENFAKAKRKDRSVKQANFLVLRETVMPSVLIELGFLTNRDEARFLNSKQGQEKMAKAIAKAIGSYVNAIDVNKVSTKKKIPKKKPVAQKNTGVKQSKGKTTKPKSGVKKENTPKKQEKPKEKVVKKTSKKGRVNNGKKTEKSKKGTTSKLVFKVQLAVSRKKLSPSAKEFKGLENVSVEKTGDLYKYFFGKTNGYSRARKYLSEAKKAGFEDAFVVAFKNGKRIALKNTAIN